MQQYSCILVDDDKWSLVDMRRNIPFEAHGFKIIGEYLNAQDAFAAIVDQAPDLVIADIRMGTMSGLDLVDTCRLKNSTCLFVIISGHSDFEYAQHALNSGVSHFLLKPIVASEGAQMLNKVRELLVSNESNEVVSDTTADKIIQYVRQNYHTRCSLDDLANHFHLNKSYLSELFKKETGKSFVRFRNEVRVEQAKVLLHRTDELISRVSQLCGFDDPGYFSSVFRLMTGYTPQQYRRSRYLSEQD